MTAARAKDDHAWEKEFAPKITRGRVVLTLVVWGAWIVFLAVLSAQRWFGALQ